MVPDPETLYFVIVTLVPVGRPGRLARWRGAVWIVFIDTFTTLPSRSSSVNS